MAYARLTVIERNTEPQDGAFPGRAFHNQRSPAVRTLTHPQQTVMPDCVAATAGSKPTPSSRTSTSRPSSRWRAESILDWPARARLRSSIPRTRCAARVHGLRRASGGSESRSSVHGMPVRWQSGRASSRTLSVKSSGMAAPWRRSPIARPERRPKCCGRGHGLHEDFFRPLSSTARQVRIGRFELQNQPGQSLRQRVVQFARHTLALGGQRQVFDAPRRTFRQFAVGRFSSLSRA